jgi:hypothetical protein
MPDVKSFCPASKTTVTLTLSMQRKPLECHNQPGCRSRAYVKCLLRCPQISGAKKA